MGTTGVGTLVSIDHVIQFPELLSDTLPLITLYLDVSALDGSASTTMLFEHSCDVFHRVRIVHQSRYNCDHFTFASLRVQPHLDFFPSAVVSFHEW
jgi:hypothetical protein